MKRARRFPQRLVRWTSLCVCFALVLTSFVLFPSQASIGKNARSGTPNANSGAQRNGQERHVTPRPPQPGPPPGNTPNLDDMRGATDQWRRHGGHGVHAPDPIPSIQRRWRHGQSSQRATSESKSNAVKANHARTLIPLPQGTSDMGMARIDPHNRTGTGAVDLLSNNFNWSLGLVGLKGRGLDLGLSLAYNSLAVWTVSGNYVAFDLDQGNPSPGFRLGFPTVQGPYTNGLTNTTFYILITPSGGHQELRQISTNVYQAVDATYSQLVYCTDQQGVCNDQKQGNRFVYLAGGSRLTFYPNPAGTEWHCTEVKDRNGNFLTIDYQSTDDIHTVTDTLGRVITFTYGTNGEIQKIAQQWNGQEHVWATFGWEQVITLGNNFPTLNPSGWSVGMQVPVLTSVGLPDGSKYYFHYDSSYGVVTKIRHYAYAGNERRQTTYTTNFTSTDSPRVTAERDWAASWNGDTDETPASGEEAVTTFSHDGSTCVVTAPDGTIYKELYGGTGWQSGLTTGSEVWSGGVKKKWTSTAWTQVPSNVSYLLNPRVIQSDIYDLEGNHRKTTIDYSNSSYAAYSLPYIVQEWDGSTLLRSTYTNYNLDSTYTDKRIIGLVSESRVEDLGGVQGKTTYEYDTTTIDPQAASTTHHDSNYSTSTPRGNVTKVFSWDVTASNTYIRRAQIVYDTAGSVMSNADALDHPNSITYSSAYYYAYPTTVSDAAGNQSTIQYAFDTGAVTQTHGPPTQGPQGLTDGEIQNMAYDSVGRLQWITRPDGFWRYVAYADRGDAVMSQVSIAAYPTSAWSIAVVDGADRTRLVGHDLPNSTGGYAGAFTLYDNMGRTSQQSNVEEANAYWSPAGDDSAGWSYTTQTYDWKGRPLVTTSPDNTTREVMYGGCGCAGGAVVVTRDEVGRRQKTTFDPLGRLKRTEILFQQPKSETLNGSGTVYSTTENTFDALDHVTQVTQTDNATSAYQTTTMSYEGYGRLHTKHVPEQSSGTATTYAYNDDDTIHVVTDARGASATYSYYNRHLVHTIEYYAPSGGAAPPVAATPNVTFEYDPAGNRTSATQRDSQNNFIDSSTYVYDQLSRLTSETYQFADLSGGPYTLNYGYNLGGELTSLSIPFASQSVGYSYDSIGRLSSMSASGFQASYYSWPNSYTQTVGSFISSMAYRAWGAPKGVTYGNAVTESYQYNSRLQPTSYTLGNVSYTNTNVSPNQSLTSMNWTYDYYDDGRVSFAHDSSWNFFDRSFSYDHAARLAEADTNKLARGQTWDYWHADPYKQTSSYDVWNNVKFTGYQFNHQQSDSATYTNNRRSDQGYDADGNVTSNLAYGNTIDTIAHNVHAISNQMVGDGSTQWPRQPASEIAQTYEAGGRPSKRTQVRRQDDRDPETGEYYGVLEDTFTDHYIYSSVLGAQVVDLDQYGQANIWVYAGGRRIATAIAGSYGNTTFEHHSPVTTSRVTTNGHSSYRIASRDERDPETAAVALQGGSYQAASNFNQPLLFIGGDPSDFAPGVTLDGMPVTRYQLGQLVGSGVAEKAPPTTVWANGQWNFVHFNYNSEQYAISVFSHYDYTTVTVDGRTSGAYHPVFDEVNLAPEGPGQNTGFDLVGIKRLVNRALGNTDCAQFMSRVLNAASTQANPVLDGGNASSIFNDFLNQKHGGLTREKPRGSLGYGSPTGHIAKGNAKIFLVGGAANQTVVDAIGVIDELAHLAGSKESFTDQVLATIVHGIPEYAALSRMTTSHSNVFDPNYERKDEAAKNPNAGGWSSYFHDIQKQKCPVGN